MWHKFSDYHLETDLSKSYELSMLWDILIVLKILKAPWTNGINRPYKNLFRNIKLGY